MFMVDDDDNVFFLVSLDVKEMIIFFGKERKVICDIWVY